MAKDGYWLPYVDAMPESYWNVIPDGDARNFFLCESETGLAAKALRDGKTTVAIWESRNPYNSYKRIRADYDASGMKCLGDITAVDLALLPEEASGSLRKFFKGYVLTDYDNNPESMTVAVVASHVYNALIVDVKLQPAFEAAGYDMLYDATGKTTEDSWREFKDKCNNSALIFEHVTKAELSNIAIANDLFEMNINKKFATREGGNNMELFEEVLAWLAPNAPCYGADAGNDEGEMDEVISRYGCHWVPFDWGYNTTMTSFKYEDRQEGIKYTPLDPVTIDYSKDKRFVSYYMSDGDNCQWLMQTFDDNWYMDPFVSKTKCSFGMAVGNLSMISPVQAKHLLDTKDPSSSIFERGSYYFLDQLGEYKDRDAILKQMAEAQAAQMKRSGVVLLGTVTRGKVDTEEAMKGYQALVDANDDMVGIIAIAYSPYADSKQEILWVTNKKGIDIPVIMTTYCIWNKKDYNDPDEGTPAYIAHKMLSDQKKYNAICIHCWSRFTDIGDSDDELAENLYPGKDAPQVGRVECADLCTRRLDDNYETCSLEELFWRVRMEYRPEQTKALLKL
ncbi:MAG: hypothetical protein MJY56_00175 [Bacteroidales bacterium]|nr:hypothetical protein [Bacteroidales bacterium]